jgi:hypothetical protein
MELFNFHPLFQHTELLLKTWELPPINKMSGPDVNTYTVTIKIRPV